MCCLVIFTGVVASGVIYWRFNDQLVAAKLTDLERETELQATRFSLQIDELTRDARFLSRTPPVQAVIDATLGNGREPVNGSTLAVWKTRLSVIFREMMVSQPSYVQIRFIGVANDGRELVRVDRLGVGESIQIVPEDLLQSKASRGYVQEALAMPLGSVYLSPISLNRERGKIQRPHLPVIRAALPMYADSGEPFGILVINFALTEVLKNLTTVANPTHQYFITNENGFYLKHPEAGRSFDFEFGTGQAAIDDFPLLESFATASRGTASAWLKTGRQVVSAREVTYGPPESQRKITIIVTDSFADVTDINRQVFQQVGLALVLLLLLGLTLALWLSRVVTKPITRLTESIETMEASKVGWQKPPGLIAEAGQLGDALENAFESLDSKSQELQESNKALQQFAYIASHDLQEPVRTIQNFSNMLSKSHASTLDEKGRKYLQFINHSAQRMRELIAGLLEYSRLGMQAAPEPVDLNELLETIQQDMQSTIKDSNAQLTVGKLPELRLYPLEMRVLLQNLISNAIKYVPAGREPRVSVDCQPQNGGWLLSVVDNGIGIEPEFREQVFGIFQRLHGAGLYDGTGIGLANCSKIVELHHGKIWVDGAPCGGSAFKVWLREVGSADSPAG